jgi:hypothetical protein
LGDEGASDHFSRKVYANSTKEGYENSHKWMYDFYGLRKILLKVGFSKVERGRHGRGSFPDVVKLDTAVKNSLVVECVK